MNFSTLCQLLVLTLLFIIFNHTVSLGQGDSFCTSTSISIGTNCTTQSGSTIGFTDDAEDVNNACGGNEDDEGWYWILGGSNGMDYTVEVDGTGSTDMVVSVVGVNGILCDTYDQIDCADDVISSTETITFTWDNTWDYYYIQVLREEFSLRQRSNHRYSLRAFSKLLGINSSNLSACFNGPSLT